MARLYANENFPLPVVESLRQLGHDVLTTQQVGKSGEGVPDEEVLRFATSEGRAVVTLNRRDFMQLHRMNSQHAGIIACTADEDFPRQAVRVHAAIELLPTLETMLIRVNRPAQ